MYTDSNHALFEKIDWLAKQWLASGDRFSLRVLVNHVEECIKISEYRDLPRLKDFALTTLCNTFWRSQTPELKILDPEAQRIERILLDHDGWKYCTTGTDSSYALAELFSRMIRELGVDGKEYPTLLKKISVVVSEWAGVPVSFTSGDDVGQLHDALFGKSWSLLYASEIEDAFDDPRRLYITVMKPPFIFTQTSQSCKASLPDNLTI